MKSEMIHTNQVQVWNHHNDDDVLETVQFAFEKVFCCFCAVWKWCWSEAIDALYNKSFIRCRILKYSHGG